MVHVVLAHVVRSGFVEGEHHGSAVVLDPGGTEMVAAGAPERPIFPRSANKPIQVVAMLRAGLDLDGHLLALAASSHSGERYHRDGVRRMLARGGLDAAALAVPAALPLDVAEAAAYRALGATPSPVAHNCSGKHAAMLLTCLENDWPLESYRSADHPLQRHIADTIADLAGERPAATGVDGCGAPVYAVSLSCLARAYARIATARSGAEHRLAEAMRHHPEWLGGTGRDLTALLRDVPGLIAKDGHEGVFAAALPDGGSCAVKIADGAARARGVVLAALLCHLGVDPGALTALAAPALLGGTEPVGVVEAVGL